MTRRRLSVRDLSAIVCLAAIGVLCLQLAAWQWRRANESRELADRFVSAAAAEAVAAVPSDAASDMLRFHRVQVHGHYVPDQQFLLDNIVHDGVAGYDVLTPFRADIGGDWLLVNRGWVPADPIRSVLPSVGIGAGDRTITGRVDRLLRPGIRLGAPASGAPAPVIVLSYPTAAELAAWLKRPVHDYQILLDATEADGFVRDWQVPGLGTERHLVYAGQWLLFGIGALGVAVAIPVRRSRARHET